MRRVVRHPVVGRILPDLHAEMPRNPELAAAIRGKLQTERRRRGAAVFAHAVARGELSPTVDTELLNDAIGALIYWRLVVTRGRADNAYLDRLTALIVAMARLARAAAHHAARHSRDARRARPPGRVAACNPAPRAEQEGLPLRSRARARARSRARGSGRDCGPMRGYNVCVRVCPVPLRGSSVRRTRFSVVGWSLLWMTLAGCEKPPANRCAAVPPPTGDVHVHREGACERVARRVQQSPALRRELPALFRRCVFADDGAFGVLPPLADRADGVRVVFESESGTASVSESVQAPRVNDSLDELPPMPEDLLVFERAPLPSVAFLKWPTHLRVVPFRGAAPVDFWSKLPSKPSDDIEWVDVARTSDGFFVTYRLPALTWQRPVAYGGHRAERLLGVEDGMHVTAEFALQPQPDFTPTRGIRGCAEQTTVADAEPAQLWAAAQCERLGEIPLEAVVRHVERRCKGLLAAAFPLVQRSFRLSADERGGKRPKPGESEQLFASLERVHPPSACFADDMGWDEDYTGRGWPLKMPQPALIAEWSTGLAALRPR